MRKSVFKKHTRNTISCCIINGIIMTHSVIFSPAITIICTLSTVIYFDTFFCDIDTRRNKNECQNLHIEDQEKCCNRDLIFTPLPDRREGGVLALPLVLAVGGHRVTTGTVWALLFPPVGVRTLSCHITVPTAIPLCTGRLSHRSNAYIRVCSDEKKNGCGPRVGTVYKLSFEYWRCQQLRRSRLQRCQQL